MAIVGRGCYPSKYSLTPFRGMGMLTACMLGRVRNFRPEAGAGW